MRLLQPQPADPPVIATGEFIRQLQYDIAPYLTVTDGLGSVNCLLEDWEVPSLSRSHSNLLPNEDDEWEVEGAQLVCEWCRGERFYLEWSHFCSFDQ